MAGTDKSQPLNSLQPVSQDDLLRWLHLPVTKLYLDCINAQMQMELQRVANFGFLEAKTNEKSMNIAHEVHGMAHMVNNIKPDLIMSRFGKIAPLELKDPE